MPNAATTYHTASSTTARAATTATTAPSDTSHHDSVKVKSQPRFAPHYLSGFPDSTGNDSAFKQINQLQVMEIPTGSDAKEYTNSPLHDTGSMAIFLLGILFVIISYRTGYKYIENFTHNIFSVRRRENVFDDRTVNETQIMSALIVNTCIMEGLLLFYGISFFNPSFSAAMYASVFKYVAIFTGIAVAFFLLQLLMYGVLGFVFGNKTDTKIWLNGFRASQSLLGLLLLPCTAITLVYPDAVQSMLYCSMVLYISARVVFIVKGYRIFFGNLASTLYFILYLCSVEIVPPVLTYAGTILICNFLQS